MTSYLDIANRSLQAIGIRKRITSLTQDSVEAVAVNNVFDSTRRALLRMAPWNFATKAANLVYITSAPGTPENTSAATTQWQPGQPKPPWLYEYQYPQDCLRPIRIISSTQTGFASTVPITTAVTGGAAAYYQGGPVRYNVASDTFYNVTGVSIVNGGSGFVFGELITLAGTPAGSAPIGAPCQLLVTNVTGGAVTGVSIVQTVGGTQLSPSGNTENIGGSYFATQPNPVAMGSTTGVGTGATFNLTYNPVAQPQRVVLTNQEFATLEYVQDVGDPNVMDDQFQEAWVCVLASSICMQVSGDKSLAQMAVQEANRIIVAARVGDGNEGLTINDVTPDWIRTRGWAGRDVMYSGPYSGMDWGGLWGAWG